MAETKLQAVYPPTEIFKNKAAGNPGLHTLREAEKIFYYDRIEKPEEGGIYMYKFGATVEERDGQKYYANVVRLLHPEKGFPYPEASAANNIGKRLLSGQIRWLFRNPLALIGLIRKKSRIEWLQEFTEVFGLAMDPHLLDDNLYTPIARELRKLIKTFLIKLGYPERLSNDFGELVSSMLEYDSAYRYRAEDLLSETSALLLIEDPIREFKKIVRILKERDPRLRMHERFESIVFLFRVAFMVPGVKKAFQAALHEIDFTKMQMDEADRYHSLRLSTYNFGGRTIEDRWAEYLKLHNNNPPQDVLVQLV